MNGHGAVLLVGGGRMGGAMARGWNGGERLFLVDPNVAEMPGAARIDRIDAIEPSASLTLILAVKPQILPDVLPQLRRFADAGCLIISIVAGAPLRTFADAFGKAARVIRAMPNTPAAVLRGITAAVAAPGLDDAGKKRAAALLGAVGDVIWLEDEAMMDVVTALSGSGPAYFFRFAEALARAGAAEGLDPTTAMRLVRATFVGAAALADARSDTLEALRVEVTSPGGVTAAALASFDRDDALDELAAAACSAGAARSRSLAS